MFAAPESRLAEGTVPTVDASRADRDTQLALKSAYKPSLEAHPNQHGNTSSDIMSALDGEAPHTQPSSKRDEKITSTPPFTQQEREQLLKASEEYGRERGKIEIELEAYRKDPPTTKWGRERVEELTSQIEKLDNAATERMSSLKERLENDPELNVRLQLEFTREVRDLRCQQAFNTLRTEGTEEMISTAQNTLTNAQEDLKNLGWMEKLLGGKEPLEAIIKQEKERAIPNLKRQLTAFQEIQSTTDQLVDHFIENQTAAVLANARGETEKAQQLQAGVASNYQTVLGFDKIQKDIISVAIEINKQGWQATNAAFDSYMGTLETTIESCRLVRDTCVVVGTGVATGGLGLIAGASIGVGIAVTTRAGGNALAALTSDKIDFDDVFKDFKADMTGDLALVVSGVLGAGVGGAVTRGLVGRSTSLLRQAIAASSGGATAGSVSEGVLIAKEYVTALEEFEAQAGIDKLSDAERGEKLTKFLKEKGLSSEDLTKRLETALVAGAVGGSLGMAGSRVGQAVTTTAKKVATELAEGAADAVAGEAIAAVIQGKELSLKAIVHGMMAAGMGSIAARAEIHQTKTKSYTPPPATTLEIKSNTPVEIGRSPHAEYQISQDQLSVSGRHAAIWTGSDGKVYVKDGSLDGKPSTNGTFVVFPDGREVRVGERPIEIQSGCLLRLGSEVYLDPKAKSIQHPVAADHAAVRPKNLDRDYVPRSDTPDGEDGRTMLAADRRQVYGYQYGKNGEQDRYLGRPVIASGTPIDGGVYIGVSRREAIVVDFRKDHVLEQKYHEFMGRMEKLSRGNPEKFNKLLIQELHDFVDREMGGHNSAIVKKLDEVLESHQLKDDHKVNLGLFISEKAGVCRHRALMVGAFLERMIKDGRVEGSIEVRRNTREQGAHAWALFTNGAGDQIVIDPMQGFVGRPDDARAYWDYRDAATRQVERGEDTQVFAIHKMPNDNPILRASAEIVEQYHSNIRAHTTPEGHSFLDWGNINGLDGKPELLARARSQVANALHLMSENNGLLPAGFRHNTEQIEGVTFIRLNNGGGNTRVVIAIDKNKIPHVVGCYTHGDGRGQDYDMFHTIMKNALKDDGFRAVFGVDERVLRR